MTLKPRGTWPPVILPNLALKLREEVTRNPNQGASGPEKRMMLSFSLPVMLDFHTKYGTDSETMQQYIPSEVHFKFFFLL